MIQSYVVFGAYGGIGSALCSRLAKKGAKLLLAGRDEVRLSGLAAALGAEALCLDACNLQQVESCMRGVGCHGRHESKVSIRGGPWCSTHDGAAGRVGRVALHGGSPYRIGEP